MKTRIRELRKSRGMTMKQLGELLGLAESTVSQYENDKRQPDNETLLKLGEIFDVTVGYILGVEENERSFVTAHEHPTFDAFTYAMQNEAKDLTDMDKQILLSMAKQLNDARKKKNGETG